TEAALATPAAPEHLLALDEALTRLGALDARQAEVVELRYFTGLTIPEAAEVLGLSPATVKRDWTAARAWLHAALSEAA
ncbi:MAG: ECF-type sigma factor, partial [Bacteroidota bacterium]